MNNNKLRLLRGVFTSLILSLAVIQLYVFSTISKLTRYKIVLEEPNLIYYHPVHEYTNTLL